MLPTTCKQTRRSKQFLFTNPKRQDSTLERFFCNLENPYFLKFASDFQAPYPSRGESFALKLFFERMLSFLAHNLEIVPASKYL